MNCKNCIYWNFQGYGGHPICDLHEIRKKENADPKRDWFQTGDNYLASFQPGPDFGCIHFKKFKAPGDAICKTHDVKKSDNENIPYERTISPDLIDLDNFW